MKFSYLWLKEFVRITHTPKELAALLTMRAFEVESIQAAGSDAVFDIAIAPNRVPDAVGHIGMAREIGAILGAKCKVKNAKFSESKKYKTKDTLTVSIKDRDGCKRYVGRVIRNITIKESPQWMQERLSACGLRPINVIVDATNYVMLETGQPLHVFDLDKIGGGTISVRRAHQNEAMTTLDGQKVMLSSEDLVIADEMGPLALAGIKGGVKAEVDVATKHIALEAATFDGVSVRKTSKRLGIRTDASYRFEHNLHPELALQAMERLTALLRELSGGEVAAGVIDAYPKKERVLEIAYVPDDANARIGLDISAKTHEKILTRIGCAFKKKTFRVAGVRKGGYIVRPPAMRRDIMIFEDLIEEVIRIYGYEHVPEIFPHVFVPAARNDAVEWTRFVRRNLLSSGYSELYRYAFIGERDVRAFGASAEEHIKLKNPVSPDLRYLVREPYENMFPFVKSEIGRTDALRVFSIDKGFLKKKISGEDGDTHVFSEETYCTIVSATAKSSKITGADARSEFLMMKGVVSNLLDSMGITDHWFDGAAQQGVKYQLFSGFDAMHPFRRAEIKIGDETIGVLGEIHPAILDACGIGGRMQCAELSMSALHKRATAEIEFRDIPKFPAIERDIAVLVSEGTRIDDVQGEIENAGGALLEDVDFFDEYSGEGIEDGMRSLAFRLVFRDQKRTLEEKEVAAIMKKILAVLQEKGWEVR